MTNERLEIKGNLSFLNYTSAGALYASTGLGNAAVNLTITNINGTLDSNYSFTTNTSTGAFYSKSDYYKSAIEITSPNSASSYTVRAEYVSNDSGVEQTWFSEVEIRVVNETVDKLRVSSEKSRYNPSQSMNVEVEAIKIISDRILHIANVTANGTLRSTSKAILQSFNCTTGTNGKCIVSLTAPSSYGNYFLELNNFKTFGSFSVIPFTYSMYMKDEFGKSLKNVFALNEQAKVEVTVSNASTSDVYTFSGYIVDSSGTNVMTINSTTLNSGNDFTNAFLFTVNSINYAYGTYTAYVSVTKTGDGTINSTTSFKVQDWTLSTNKRSSKSGFEYAYSSFANKTLFFETYPTYRTNGTVIVGINVSSFSVTLKDKLDNTIQKNNVTWNASCGQEGCYEYNLSSPGTIDEYTIYISSAYDGSVQTVTRNINIIDGFLEAQSTDKNGNLKDLFGTNEYVYLTLTAYNRSNAQFNLSDAEVFTVSYMNGTQVTYTQVAYNAVNSSNGINEWGWNATNQRIKLDAPKIGGVYDAFIFGDNRTMGTTAKFILNPYTACVVPKDTPGEVTSGYYYVWQFKTTDTIYFELQLTQADNPLGRATASNSTAGNSSGQGSQCTVDTASQQTITNATITILEVKNTESGVVQSINLSESTCQAKDNTGGYSCTAKPLDRWEGGVSTVKFRLQGQDGTEDVVYGRFEARSFYLYGWPQTWQNGPTSNLTLYVQLYEAGSGWWGNGGGLSGTVTLKRIEYQGSNGEWIWPPVDYDYNVSAVNSSSITGGTGTINVPVTNTPAGAWKNGYYRAVLEGRTSNGDVDYGYAWFGIKQWDVYGTPVECTASNCQYKNYFNSRDNITMYIKISQAGAYSYSYLGGQGIGGTVNVSVKKINDCRKWPCKELNSSTYTSSVITVNASSPWYWNADISGESDYFIYLNKTSGTWGNGYYSVVLDVNGSDTGSGWFNTIPFYIAIRPTDVNGSNYKYNIKNNENMYFNVSTTRDYKGYYAVYNKTDYINTTLEGANLRVWDETLWETREYLYPQHFNFSPTGINGTALLNVSFNNGSWPSGYYSGELNLKNSQNETTSNWLWFRVKPFRVQIDRGSYNIDDDQCTNGTISIYEPTWYRNSMIYGNYSIINVYENIWSSYGMSKINYTNYTTTSFNGTANITVCPNGNDWGTGSWGGYHYLNVIVRDNINNNTEPGWLSFKAVPFQVSWGVVVGGTNKLTSQHLTVPVTLTKYSTGASASGNISKVYQWRYDNYVSRKEEYNFSVGNCYSNVSGQCNITGTHNVIVYAPSGGWKVGYNYLYAEWNKVNDDSILEDWNGIYIDGREAYNGYYYNSDRNGYWRYDFRHDENLTIKLYTRDMNYNPVNVTVTNVQYALSNNNCWDESCRSYTNADWSLVGGSSSVGNDGNAIIDIAVPSSNWAKGDYYIKATVSGNGSTSTITGGYLRVKDYTAPNITVISPVNNQNYTEGSVPITFTTTENSQCSLSFYNFDIFQQWGFCNGWNTTNSSNGSLTQQTIGACNTSKNYQGASYHAEYVSENYHSTYTGSGNTWTYAANNLVTGGTTHTYTLDVTNHVPQHYSMYIWCSDSDWNYRTERATFYVNTTSNASLIPPEVTVNTPISGSYISASSVTFNYTLNKDGYCKYSLNNGTNNYTMSSTNNRTYNATNNSIAEGRYFVSVYCNDTFGNNNYTTRQNLTIDRTAPVVNYMSQTATNNSNLTNNWIYVRVNFTETYFNNITFNLYNSTTSTVVNSTFYPWVSYTYVNWTNLGYLNYTFNVIVKDKANNQFTTPRRYINLSTS